MHALGARIIFYVEGFIITKMFTVGKRHGAAWSIIGKDNKPIEKPYPGSWKLCPAAEGMRRVFRECRSANGAIRRRRDLHRFLWVPAGLGMRIQEA